MRVYGSFNNRMMEASRQPQPEIGMGVTRCSYTDRHAYTIVEVKSPTRIVVQRDLAERTDDNGMSECQTYKYTSNPEGSKKIVTLRKNGRWVERGESSRGPGFMLGDRQEYYDYSF